MKSGVTRPSLPLSATPASLHPAYYLIIQGQPRKTSQSLILRFYDIRSLNNDLRRPNDLTCYEEAEKHEVWHSRRQDGRDYGGQGRMYAVNDLEPCRLCMPLLLLKVLATLTNTQLHTTPSHPRTSSQSRSSTSDIHIDIEI